MKAAIFRGVRDLRVEDVPEPEAGPGDILVEVKAVGVCGSDLHSYTHGSFVEPGQIMGHEFAAEVLQVGDEVEGIAAGDRVTAMPIVPCGDCPRCAEGRPNLCPVAWTQALAYGRPGAFAERLRVPGPVVGETVFPLGDDVSDEAGALAEPLAVAVHAVKLAGSIEGATALVLGLGTIGLQVTQVLQASGIGRVLAADLSPLRREVAASFGADLVDNADGLGAGIDAALGDGEEIAVVFECSGVPALANAALERVRGGGTVVMIALYDDPVTLDTGLLVQKEIRLQGSIAYTSEDFAEALSLLGAGTVASAPLITHRESLDDVSNAFAAQLEKDSSIKVLLLPNG